MELKPCPFCGSKPHWVEDLEPYAECSECMAQGPTEEITSLIDEDNLAWNRRTGDTDE